MLVSAAVLRHDTCVLRSVSNPRRPRRHPFCPSATLVQGIRYTLLATNISSYAQVHRDSRWRVRCCAYICSAGLPVAEAGGCGVQVELTRNYRARVARMLHHPQRVPMHNARVRQHSKCLLSSARATRRGSCWLRVLRIAQLFDRQSPPPRPLPPRTQPPPRTSPPLSRPAAAATPPADEEVALSMTRLRMDA
jgi:hypothetical protein